MADQRSIEMLAFNFGSRTIAYRRLAEGLSRALSAFSSCMREHLVRVIKADQCAQYVDDIDIAANDAEHLIKNLRATFECIREAGLKLTMHKCHFDATAIDILGRTITPEVVKPQKDSITNFLKKQIPEIQKGLATIPRIPQLLQELHTETVRKIGSLLSTTQEGREGLSDIGVNRTIQRNQ